MDDRNDGIDMRSDFDRELDDMADKISKHGDDIIDRDDSNNRRQRRANRYDDDDMDSYSVQKRKRRASRYDDTDAYDDDCDDIAVHGTFSQRVGRACVNYWKNAFDFRLESGSAAVRRGSTGRQATFALPNETRIVRAVTSLGKACPRRPQSQTPCWARNSEYVSSLSKCRPSDDTSTVTGRSP